MSGGRTLAQEGGNSEIVGGKKCGFKQPKKTVRKKGN